MIYSHVYLTTDQMTVYRSSHIANQSKIIFPVYECVSLISKLQTIEQYCICTASVLTLC